MREGIDEFVRRVDAGYGTFCLKQIAVIVATMGIDLTSEQSQLINTLAPEWHGPPEDLLETALELS